MEVNLDVILNKFNRDDLIFNDLLNIRISGDWVDMIDSTINNKEYIYNQDYTLVIEDNQFYINNWLLHGTDKFYNFQDKYTYKNFKSAIKKFIELNKRGVK